MNISSYAELLKTIVSQKSGCVILLNGSWGVGKTSFWNEFVKQEFSEVPYAYVTLFGKKSIEQIQGDALSQVFAKNKHIERLEGFAKSIKALFKTGDGGFDLNFGITGSTLGMLLSLLKEKDLKDNLVCIDDFERKSSCLQIDEIIGFASVLAERFECKVVLIMDESKIQVGAERDKYDEYKEKMVTHEILFNPDQSELIGSMTCSIDSKYRKGVLQAIGMMNETNLRTIKKIAQRVDFIVKVSGDKLDARFCDQLGFELSLLVSVYCELGRNGLSDISSSLFGQSKESNVLPNERMEQVKRCRNKVLGRISNYSDLDKFVWEFIQTHSLDMSILEGFSGNITKTIEDNSVRDTIFELLEKYTFDLSYPDENYCSDVIRIFNDKKGSIIEVLSFDNYLYIVESLSQAGGNPVKIAQLKHETMKDYVASKVCDVHTYEDYRHIVNSQTIGAICRSDSVIESYLESKMKGVVSAVHKVPNVVAILETIRQQSGWNVEDENLINSLSLGFIVQSIKSSPEFFHCVIDFIKWRGSSSESFASFHANVIAAIKAMGKDGLGDFRYDRISKLIGIVS